MVKTTCKRMRNTKSRGEQNPISKQAPGLWGYSRYNRRRSVKHKHRVLNRKYYVFITVHATLSSIFLIGEHFQFELGLIRVE